MEVDSFLKQYEIKEVFNQWFSSYNRNNQGFSISIEKDFFSVENVEIWYSNTHQNEKESLCQIFSKLYGSRSID